LGERECFRLQWVKSSVTSKFFKSSRKIDEENFNNDESSFMYFRWVGNTDHVIKALFGLNINKINRVVEVKTSSNI